MKNNDFNTIGTAEAVRLVDRFYNGETTADEEAALLGYFNSGNVAPELQAEGEVIRPLLSRPAVPDGLQARLERSINSWNMVEATASRRTRRISLRWMAAAAACLVLILSATLILHRRTVDSGIAGAGTITPTMQETYDNPEDAYAATRRALTMFSECLNDGLSKAAMSTDNNKTEEQ